MMTKLQAGENTGLKAWHPLTQQGVFRQLMRAFSYPGRVETLCDAVAADDMRGSALTRVLATLLDGEATLADPDCMLDPHTLALLEARTVPVEQAQFVVVLAEHAPRFEPALGSLESPERGASVILRVACLGEGSTLHLAGPGIDGAAQLQVRGLDAGWLAARTNWNAGFPLGIDLILVDDQRAAALPRTTRITCEGEY